MPGQKIVGFSAADLVAAFEDVRRQKLLGDLEHRIVPAEGMKGLSDGREGEDRIAGSGFDQKRSGGKQRGQIGHLTESGETRNIIAGAVMKGENAVSEGTEVAADDDGCGAGVNARGKQGEHSSARDAHDPDAVLRDLGTGLKIIQQPPHLLDAESENGVSKMSGEKGSKTAGGSGTGGGRPDP